MIVLIFAIRVTLSARHKVTTAGNPSGTAATAREIAVRSISNTGRFCTIASKNNTMQIPREPRLKNFPSSPSFFCSGVVSSRLSCISAAIFPIWVCKPTAQTIPVPRPALTIVDKNVILFRSPSGILPPCFPESLAVCFCTGRFSPVSAASWSCKFSASTSRRSAGTIAPACRQTRSPTASFAAGISCSEPSRITTARGCISCFKESSARCAFPSCKTPTAAFKQTTNAIIPASLYSPSSTEISAAASST